MVTIHAFYPVNPIKILFFDRITGLAEYFKKLVFISIENMVSVNGYENIKYHTKFIVSFPEYAGFIYD